MGSSPQVRGSLASAAGRGTLAWSTSDGRGFERTLLYVNFSLLQWCAVGAGLQDTWEECALKTIQEDLKCLTERVSNSEAPEVAVVDFQGPLELKKDSLEQLICLLAQCDHIVFINVNATVKTQLKLLDPPDGKGQWQRQHLLLETPDDFPFSGGDIRETPQGLVGEEKSANSHVFMVSLRQSKTAADATLQSFAETLIQTVAENSKCRHIEVELHKALVIYLSHLVGQSHQNVNSRLRSTPLKTKGVYQAACILGQPQALLWVAHQLALMIYRFTQTSYPNQGALDSKIRLLACTQHGTKLAVAVQAILNWTFAIAGYGPDVIDRYGPSGVFVEEYLSDEQSRPYHYIYIGDFVIAGTELKIATIHAHQRGSTIVAAFVIGSLLPSVNMLNSQSVPLRARAFGFPLYSLVDLGDLPTTDPNLKQLLADN
jgi:hypothetical protein